MTFYEYIQNKEKSCSPIFQFRKVLMPIMTHLVVIKRNPWEHFQLMRLLQVSVTIFRLPPGNFARQENFGASNTNGVGFRSPRESGHLRRLPTPLGFVQDILCGAQTAQQFTLGLETSTQQSLRSHSPEYLSSS